jgi:sporulation protein YlmC with PRC-barrel domain
MELRTFVKCAALSAVLGAPAWVSAAQQASGEAMSEPGAQQQAQATAQEQNRLMSMQVKQIQGKSVVNPEGDKVGKVEKIVQNRMDDSIDAVVSVGGFLGIGDKDITIPIDQLQLEGDKLLLSRAVTEDQLKQQPEYQPAQYAEVEENRILAEVTGAGIPGAEPQVSFQQLDVNNDGVISQEEAQQDQQLSNNWEQADQNADNQIDRAEFSAFEQQMGAPGQEQPPQTQPGGTMEEGGAMEQQQQPGSEPGGQPQ